MRKVKDIVGEVFGRWTVIEHAGIHVSPSGVRRTTWVCRCECGTVRTLNIKLLRGGGSLSCGCLQKEMVSEAAKTHGLSRTPMHFVWNAIKQRCLNPNDANYKNYGGRGITVSDSWKNSFEEFIRDMGYPPFPKAQIDRIDNDGPYCKENCRWASRKVQALNTRSNHWIEHNGEKRTVSEWADILGINRSTIFGRLAYGFDTPQVLYQGKLPRQSKKLAKSSGLGA